MSSAYLQSSQNCHYLAKETAPGIIPAIDGNHRVVLSGLRMATSHLNPRRNDKWGSRSVGEPIQSLKKEASFQFSTYHYVNNAYPSASRYGGLLEASMGGDALYFPGGVVESLPSAKRIRFVSPHALSKMMAVSYSGEIRFVSEVVDSQTVELNAAFSVAPTPGNALSPAHTYRLSRTLGSFSLFDYWSPGSSVQRIGRGAVADKMKIEVNGDYHALSFSGPMVDVVDSLTFQPGAGGLAEFPAEPGLLDSVHPMPVPGHLGQAHIGGSQFHTLTEAEITLSNGVDGKGREFGSLVPRSFASGRRTVTFSASLYVTDEDATRSLHEYSSGRSPIPVMVQLGDRQGHLMGIYLPKVVPASPGFDDRDNRLIWRLDRCVAHGVDDDEMCIGMA